MTSQKIGVAVITHQAKHHLKNCLPPYLDSALKPRVVLINSSSNDGTVELARDEFGVESLVIPRKLFNHGSTRDLARKYLNCNIVVMTTPDAYATGPDFLETLVEPILKGKASIAYARQIPHKEAGFFESFAREFNYPDKSHIRGIRDIQRYGAYTFFCSDSCAAYSNAALEEIGGFAPVLIGEDTVATAKLLHRGHKIAYVSEAVVHHSHGYTLVQEFQRHFDTGLARESYRDLISCAGKDSARGHAYLKAMFKKLNRQAPYLIPYAILQTLAKWTGYRLGQASVKASGKWKKIFSGQDFYWT